jgi:hypothetical protein
MRKDMKVKWKVLCFIIILSVIIIAVYPWITEWLFDQWGGDYYPQLPN